MTSNETSAPGRAERNRWWSFWRSVPRPLRRRRARLSDDVDSDAASYWIRGGF